MISRRTLLIGAACLVALGGGAFAYVQAASDEGRAVDVRETAKEAAKGSASVERGDRPAAGTYEYAAKGRESVDVLTGSEHTYPGTVPGIVRLDPKQACEWSFELKVLEEHVEHEELCTDESGVRVLELGTDITFFGSTDSDTYVCEGDGGLRLVRSAKPGTQATWTCRSSSTVTKRTARTLEPQQVTIDGEDVPARRVDIAVDYTGKVTGETANRYWLADSGLILKFETTTDTTSDSALGETRYREHAVYTLTSTEPVKG